MLNLKDREDIPLLPMGQQQPAAIIPPDDLARAPALLQPVPPLASGQPVPPITLLGEAFPVPTNELTWMFDCRAKQKYMDHPNGKTGWLTRQNPDFINKKFNAATDQSSGAFWEFLKWIYIGGVSIAGIILYIGPCLAFGLSPLTQAIFLLGGVGTNLINNIFFTKKGINPDKLEDQILATLKAKNVDPDNSTTAYIARVIKQNSKSIANVLFAVIAAMPFIAATRWPYPVQNQVLANGFAMLSTGLIMYYINTFAIKDTLLPMSKSMKDFIYESEAENANRQLREAYISTLKHYAKKMAKEKTLPQSLMITQQRGNGGLDAKAILQAFAENASIQTDAPLKTLKANWEIEEHGLLRKTLADFFGIVLGAAVIAGLIGYGAQLWMALAVIQGLQAYALFSFVNLLNVQIAAAIVCGAPYTFMALNFGYNTGKQIFNLIVDLGRALINLDPSLIQMPYQFSLYPKTTIFLALVMMALGAASFATSAQFVLAMGLSPALQAWFYPLSIIATIVVNTFASTSAALMLVGVIADHTEDANIKDRQELVSLIDTHCKDIGNLSNSEFASAMKGLGQNKHIFLQGLKDKNGNNDADVLIKKIEDYEDKQRTTKTAPAV